MIPPDDELPEFDRLLSRLCDSELTPAQMDRLNDLLKSDRALQRRYILYLGIHATLQHTIGEELPVGPGEDSIPAGPDAAGRESEESEEPRLSRGRRPQALGTAAAALLLLAGIAGWVAWRAGRPESAEPHRIGPIVGRVSRAAGARFDRSGLSVGKGEAIHVGEYRLAEGIVQLTFARGAEVLIAAPAVFVPQSEGRLLLRSGKLTANVPGPARGFVVETPSATLTDLGTEFALDVDRSENGEVHVFRGEVIVQPRSRTDLRPVRLLGSHATRIDSASATPSGIDVDPTRFLRRLDEPESGYSRLARELGPQVYLRMEPTSDGHALIDDTAPGRPGLARFGPDCGTPWLPGRFGASLLLRGPGSGDHAVVPFAPAMLGDALSVAAWVLAESRPRWASIAKRWGRPEDQSFHFGLFLDDGDLEVHTSLPDGREFFAREGRPLPTGRWQHVAFVASRDTLILYRNGAEVARAAHPGLRPGSLGSIGLGAKLDVGGAKPDPIEPGFWDGRLDEVAIYPRALGPEEIRRLYQAAGGADPEGALDVAAGSPRDAAGAPPSPAPLPAIRDGSPRSSLHRDTGAAQSSRPTFERVRAERRVSTR